MTLLSANDGASDVVWRKTPEGLVDYEVKTQDSFTVIRLYPDRPPETKTVYGTVPCNVIGTPTMAISHEGRWGLVTNHGLILPGMRADYPTGTLLENADIQGVDLNSQDLAPPLSNMLSLIDLKSEELRVADRVLFDDHPTHVLPTPDGKHFIVAGSQKFYVYRIDEGKLVEVRATPHYRGLTCLWIHPDCKGLIATQGDVLDVTKPSAINWYKIDDTFGIEFVAKVNPRPGLDVELLDTTAIPRISPDGRMALVCQRAVGGNGDLCGVLVVDLTVNPPVISHVIEQVGDGVESFAFHPNGKLAVVTCLGMQNNDIAVLDISSEKPSILYHLDVGGVAQGIEFTPEGDKLFVGSLVENRIEVFDVVGDFELVKSPKFLKTGHGHCSLSIGRHPK